MNIANYPIARTAPQKLVNVMSYHYDTLDDHPLLACISFDGKRIETIIKGFVYDESGYLNCLDFYTKKKIKIDINSYVLAVQQFKHFNIGDLVYDLSFGFDENRIFEILRFEEKWCICYSVPDRQHETGFDKEMLAVYYDFKIPDKHKFEIDPEIMKSDIPIPADFLSYEKTTMRPKYYGGENNTYEAIKVIEAWGLNFSLGNAVKYISRAGKKDPSKNIEDLKKAKTYLEFEIARLAGSEVKSD